MCNNKYNDTKTRYDKDILNRLDILTNGLRLPYKVAEIKHNCEPSKIFYVNKDYLVNLKNILNERRDS